MHLLNHIRTFFKKSARSSQNQDNSDIVLATAIKNAMLLILVASENAIELPQTSIANVIAVKNAHENQTLDIDTEKDFWVAYERIAQSLHPITIDSIKATFGDKRTLARRCAGNYKFLSLLTLFLLISIQIYWYIGSTLTSEINTQTQLIIKLEQKVSMIKEQQKKMEYSNENNMISDLSLKKTQLLQRISEHKNWKAAAANHLENWNQVWSDMDLLTLQPWQNPNYKTYSPEVQRRIQFVAAENTLQAISGYILPILYGLIGACFYILRQLPKEIEQLTFSMNSYIQYSLRLAQGPLAGIMVSYFLAPDPESALTLTVPQGQSLDPALTTLSPLALAFLAGYSVEFIFRFLDKMLAPSTEPAANFKKNQSGNTGAKKRKPLKKNENPE